jgi:enamine deaminase RidA (YjgF/YER057c/UK114 family)
MTSPRPVRDAGSWTKDVLAFLAGAGLGPRDAAAACLTDLLSALRERGLRPDHVVKLTFFVRAGSRVDLARRTREAAAALRSVAPSARPAVGVVAQAPERGREVALEALVLRRPSRAIDIVPKIWRGVPYVVLQAAAGREVVAGGMTGGRDADFAARTQAAFAKASSLLARERLGFGDVVRQWNFVEDITGRAGAGPAGGQNYQIFNDIRAAAYDRGGLRKGFPAATGIGAAAGGFTLELIAAAGAAAERTVAVSNPLQTDAHRYSSRVLVGACGGDGRPKMTPKFERARVVLSGGRGTCYVSGTASIVGEDVVRPGDAAGQTRATVRNIKRLVSAANLRRAGLAVAAVGPRFANVRTYVKRGEDIPDVARIVRAAFPGAAALFVIADVCREDLLVEIEGTVDVVTG